MRSALIACCLAAAAIAPRASISQEPEEPVKTYFSQLFPNPTGRNGYEELVMAGDFARTSRLLQEVQEADPAATLSAKRAALADPPVKRALQLLRTGLQKPLVPLHPRITIETTFPEFALFRNLARTLMIEQYIRLADGDVFGAIDSVRDCLKLGAACGSDILIAGLVRVAVDAIATRTFADHLGQLSARDCDRIVALALQWMSTPDPSVEVMLGEKRAATETWKRIRSDPTQVEELLPNTDDEDEAERVKAARYHMEIDALAQNPPAYTALIDSVHSRIVGRMDAEIANLQLPPWKRKLLDTKADDSLVGYLAETLMPTFDTVSDRFVTDQVKIQLLGMQAAILRYLWEHERLPDSLRQLRLPNLIMDPFTGEPLIYRRTGPRAYELSSAGPYDRGDGETPPSGKRLPIFLPRKPR